jgi:uncharacterized small protein (DUF1192 family)
MSMFDDDRPKKKTSHEIGQDLSLLSADELQARINLMKDEIERLSAELKAKGASRSAAEKLFKL